MLVILFLRVAIPGDEKDEESFLKMGSYLSEPGIDPSYEDFYMSSNFYKSSNFSYCREYIDEGQDWKVFLVPENDMTLKLKDELIKFDFIHDSFIQFKDSEDDLEDYITDSDYEDNPKACFAVVFKESADHKYNYEIRFNETKSVVEDNRRTGEDVNIFQIGDYDNTDELLRVPMEEFQRQFLRSGFLQIQNIVDNIILRDITNNKDAYISVAVVPMKSDDYLDDTFMSSITSTLPLFIVISYMIPVCRMISLIVIEKENKIKETMNIMGLSSFSYWMSWVTYYLAVYTVISIVNTIISSGIMKYSNPGIIFVYYELYAFTCIAYSILITVFFSRSRSAVMVGLMIFISTYFISFGLNDKNTDEDSKNAASLIPNVALALACNVLSGFEQGQSGVTFDNIFTAYQNYKFVTCLGFFILDTIIFILLAWYLEKVWPNDYGTKRSWYFLFTKDYWISREAKTGQLKDEVDWGANIEKVDYNTEQQKNSGKAMVIRGLKKHFGDKKAVDGLELDIYDGQIFALLGQNGAGKTTTISMLTGLLPVTEGDMTIKGLLLSKDLPRIRKMLGMCPQHNVLFPELTPKEHLYIFSIFKGLTNKKEIKIKIKEKLQEIDLYPHRNKLSKNLSGGQKRKLSLVIALIGDSPIVLLDEPTSGMDLTARRSVWDMLKNNKANKIIILTTHYMEEAEVLADRIGIMANGKLQVCGSSLFLKNRHGVGYYLTIVKEPEVASPEHTQQLVDLLQKYVPEAEMDNDIHAEIAFRLPLDSSSKFKDLFDDLDKRLKKLKLVSYSISVTTLEEVFIKVAHGSKIRVNNDETPGKSENSSFLHTTDFVLHRDKIRTSLIFLHFLALIKKRFLITIRDVKSILFEIFIPIITVIVGLGLMMLVDRFVARDSYHLEVSKYEETQNIIYYGPKTPIVSEVMNIIDEFPGVSIDSVNVDSIQEFDEELFDERDTDPYRMGSYYIESMDDLAHKYEFVVFHNLTAYQALPTYYQLMSTSILKNINSEIEIDVYNHPLPPTQEMKTVGGDGFIASTIFALGFAFIPAGIITMIVKDKETSVKHQHVISGVSLSAYWISNLVWDIVKHLVPAIVCAAMVAAFDVDALTMEASRYGGVWALMILYGVAIAPFTYASSFLFKSHASAQIITIIFHFVIGCLMPSMIFIMLLFEESKEAGKALRWVFRLVPSFCFGFGILNIGSIDIFAFVLEEEDLEPLDVESAGGDLIFMGVDFFLYLIILFIAEFIQSKPWILKRFKRDVKPENEEYETDQDVQREEQIALNTNPDDVQINVRNLKQVYHVSGVKPLVAVNDISFNVAKGECFALLGVNGAGKTSTFKILTGELAPTNGEAYIGGKSITHQLSQIREFIGYCPQFDAITDLMTGDEHLNLYCDIKGIPKNVRKHLIEEVLNTLDLAKYRNVKSGTYSGGNKRKLSVAIALIGNPKVLFLDEPSAGMDPEARKKMWKVIGDIKKMNSSVVLTTHSMEEAEALCDRMTIMVGGRFKCIGTSTHIKNKFGSGYELEVKVNLPTHAEIDEATRKLAKYFLPHSTDISESNVESCLREIGAGNFMREISERGTGSAIYQQLKTDKMVSITSFTVWAETEKRGSAIFEWIQGIFDRVEPIEHYMSLFKFRIQKQENKSLGVLFGIIEENRLSLNIGDYAITQTSLEQIFNQFAKQAEHHTPS